jgi:hypothetical protein
MHVELHGTRPQRDDFEQIAEADGRMTTIKGMAKACRMSLSELQETYDYLEIQVSDDRDGRENGYYEITDSWLR